MESQKKVWNGDVDLNDGKLQDLRDEYDDKNEKMCLLRSSNIPQSTIEDILQETISNLTAEIDFLDSGFKASKAHYEEKFKQTNCPESTLKDANWDVVEFHILLQQSQKLKQDFKNVLSSPSGSDISNATRCLVNSLASQYSQYLRNFYKKKRTSASHVVVTMLSDERRSTKPYALPVRYVPCTTLKDQDIRTFNQELKQEMKKRNMILAGTATNYSFVVLIAHRVRFSDTVWVFWHFLGTVTDGEFCSLRTKGERRPLHIWQLIQDSREKARRMSKNTLQACLELQSCELLPLSNYVLLNFILLRIEHFAKFACSVTKTLVSYPGGGG